MTLAWTPDARFPGCKVARFATDRDTAADRADHDRRDVINPRGPVAFRRHCGVDNAIPLTREAAYRIDGTIGECSLCGDCDE